MMVGNTTQMTEQSVEAFINAVEHPVRRSDAVVLDGVFQRVTGWQPKMWGPSIVGYGQYHYVYDSGRSGNNLATGFSPRKANMVVYILPGYEDFSSILERLGKYKIGKSCLYINKLADVDLDVSAELIEAGLADLAKRWPIHPSLI